MKSPAVDAYIAAFPAAVRTRLNQVRRTIRSAAPKASEVISYRIPAYRMNRILVFFAGFNQHIGLFPPVRGDARLEKAVAKYAGPKGNLRFPHDERLPLALIARIVRHSIKLDKARVAGKKPRK